MARTERFKFSHTRKIDSAHRYVATAHEAGVLMNRSAGANGSTIIVDGQPLVNFGSCSYLALEARPELREAAHRAIDDYGTQYHFSRAFLECPLYVELEQLLETLTGRPVVVAASTTLAHMSALPVLIRDSDSVIIDQFAHASLHTAVQLLPGVPLEILRHSRMDQLESHLQRLSHQAGNVWYIADGLYSMLGDFAPFEQLQDLLARYPKLHLYIDDAHSTSWLGKHGRGAALERMLESDRVIVALSLNKAFSAAGGALVLPSVALKTTIRRCGGTLLFSGPIQPPMLGAAVGSARLHLSAGFALLQAELAQRIELALKAIKEVGLDVTGTEHSPIFQAQCDSPRVAFAAHDAMRAKGYYCCVCVFPAVPMNRPGLRFTLTRHNALQDIEPFVRALDSSIREASLEVARHPNAESSGSESELRPTARGESQASVAV